MNEQFFEARGIYYRTNKFEQGRKTLIFIHGLSGSSSAWKEYEDRLENDYNILTYDLRGHGTSVKSREYNDYRVENFVVDLKSLMDFLSIDKAILIGHSFGAAIALEFLLTYPNIVTEVVFLSPDFHTRGIKLSSYVFPSISRVANLLGFFPIPRNRGGHVNYSKYHNTGDWNLRRMVADISNTGLHVYFYCLKQLYEFNREDHLKNIKVPVLIIHGANDTVVPSNNSAIMANKITNSKFVLLPKANHIIVLNNFEEVVRELMEFICAHH